MFDDLFLFAALERAIEDKRLLAVSVRKESDFAMYKRLGWHASIERDVMISEPLTGGEGEINVVLEGVESEKFALILGDLAAFTEERIDLIRNMEPEAVKINFVTSPIDGRAFLPAEGNDKMAESAVHLVSILRAAGYACYASTWYRNDVPPRIWALDSSSSFASFPFNIAAFRDEGCAVSFGFMSEVFSIQESMISVEHDALVDRLTKEIEYKTAENKAEIDTRNHYIKMLEDAMIALQPSEKIKLGGK